MDKTEGHSMILLIVLISGMLFMLVGCGSGSGGDNSSGSVSNGDCIAVAKGGWEFELKSRGMTVLHFVEGNLSQSGCYVTYDDDNIFKGNVQGKSWNFMVQDSYGGMTETLEVNGDFSGNPGDRYYGTWTINSGSGYAHGEIEGYYCGSNCSG